MSGTARRVMFWALVGALCAAAFAAYLHPDFAVAVANKVWSCF